MEKCERDYCLKGENQSSGKDNPTVQAVTWPSLNSLRKIHYRRKMCVSLCPTGSQHPGMWAHQRFLIDIDLLYFICQHEMQIEISDKTRSRHNFKRTLSNLIFVYALRNLKLPYNQFTFTIRRWKVFVFWCHVVTKFVGSIVRICMFENMYEEKPQFFTVWSCVS